MSLRAHVNFLKEIYSVNPVKYLLKFYRVAIPACRQAGRYQ